MTSPPEVVDYLGVDDLLEIATSILPAVELRDVGLLESAAHRPRSTVFGAEAYPGFHEKTAALLHSIARNHALVDGNKRLAWAAARVFCLLNGRDLALDVDDAEALVVGAAAGTLELDELSRTIAGTLRPSD